MAAMSFASSAEATAFVAAVAADLDLPITASRGGARQIGGGRHRDPALITTASVVSASGSTVTVGGFVTAGATVSEIQMAMDSVPPGGVFVFRAGTYALTAELVWPDDITVVADGAVTLQRSGTQAPILMTGVRRGVIAGITFDIAAGISDRVLINARQAQNVRWTNCTFTDSLSAQGNAEWTQRAILGGQACSGLVVEDCTIDGCQLQLGGFGGCSNIRVSRITATAPLQYVVSCVTRADVGAAESVRDVIIEDVTVTFPQGRAVSSGAIYVGTEINAEGLLSECSDVIIRRVSVEGAFPNPYRAINARLAGITRNWTIEDITVTNDNAQTSNVHGVAVAGRSDTPVAVVDGLTLRNITGTNLSRGPLNISDVQSPLPPIKGLVIENVTGNVFDGVSASSVAQLLARYGA